jgi:hypothetical protein
MNKITVIVACASLIALAGCSANGVAPLGGQTVQSQSHVVGLSAPGWINVRGVLYHSPHYMATARNAAHTKPPAILLNYANGPVLVSPKMYVIFWGYKTYSDPDKVKPLLVKYGKVAGGSALNNIYTQYYEVSNGSTVYITNPKKQFGGAWEDDGNAVPTHPTDAQVAAEALAGVAHFGYDPNGSYVVATPHGRSSNGFGSSFCAYHSAASYNGKLVSYTNLPYMPDANDCGSNWITPPSDESGIDEGVTIVEGHEYAESITDPNPPTGWYNGQYGEIGDICAWQNVQNDPFRKKSYSSQPMYSNASQSCVHSY